MQVSYESLKRSILDGCISRLRKEIRLLVRDYVQDIGVWKEMLRENFSLRIQLMKKGPGSAAEGKASESATEFLSKILIQLIKARLLKVDSCLSMNRGRLDAFILEVHRYWHQNRFGGSATLLGYSTRLQTPSYEGCVSVS